MTTLQGKSVCRGIVKAKLAFYRRKKHRISRFTVQDKEAQWQRYLKAKKEAAGRWNNLNLIPKGCSGRKRRLFLKCGKLMLDDCEYVEALRSLILEQGMNAEYAVYATGESMARRLDALEDDYIKERAQDVRDISERLLNVLGQNDAEEKFPKEPSIVAADDLTPSETVRLAGEKVLGFVLREGGIHSHTAILARNMGVPALIGVGNSLLEVYDGAEALLEGAPETCTLNRMRRLFWRWPKKAAGRRTKSGFWRLRDWRILLPGAGGIEVFANAGSSGRY